MALTIRSSTTGRVGARGLRTTVTSNRGAEETLFDEFRPPRRPTEQFLPTESTLEALIRRALDALARGIYWERGSIINLLV